MLFGFLFIDWRKENGKPGSGWADLMEDDAFKKAVRAAVDRSNKVLNLIEKVRSCSIADEPFNVENEMLTPSMKIRRHVIRETYLPRIEALYGKGRKS